VSTTKEIVNGCRQTKLDIDKRLVLDDVDWCSSTGSMNCACATTAPKIKLSTWPASRAKRSLGGMRGKQRIGVHRACQSM
jgi:hypothetical protein